MGYTSSGGAKGRGSFNNTPATTADLNKLLELINGFGNFAGGITTAERDAITGDALYVGLMIYNTTTGLVELYDGSGWKWVAGDVVGVARSTASQSILDSTLTFPTFSTAAVASGGMTFGSNGFTVPATGEYEVTSYVAYDSNGTGRREVIVNINGVDVGIFDRQLASGPSTRTPVCVKAPLSLSAGDLVRSRTLHTSGVASPGLAISDRFLMVTRLA